MKPRVHIPGLSPNTAAGLYVKKAGDTMTGDLTVPRLFADTATGAEGGKVESVCDGANETAVLGKASASGGTGVLGKSTTTSGSGYGFQAYANGGTTGTNYGLWASASNGGTNYGIYVNDGLSYFGGNVGIGIAPGGYKLYTSGGDVLFAGNDLFVGLKGLVNTWQLRVNNADNSFSIRDATGGSGDPLTITPVTGVITLMADVRGKEFVDRRSKTYTRDANGFVISVAGTGGRTVTNTRDANNFITSKSDTINTWTFTRNANNQVTAKTVT